jgi:hypothetical protein
VEDNNFKELEKWKLENAGEIPQEVENNITKNIELFKTIGESMDLFTEKLVKTIIEISKIDSFKS